MNGVEEIVPGGNKSKNAHGGRARNCQGHHDPVKDAQFAGAIDPGGIDQILDQH